MSEITLWGFDGSTYVRTIKMLLAEKGVTTFKQVPLNVLKGEPKAPEHLERHPFGKVPVLDHDGMRILETTENARYLNAGPPGNPQGSCSDGHDRRYRRLLRLRRVDRRRRGLPSLPRFRRRQERRNAHRWHRERPQGDRARHEDQGLIAVHRRRAKPCRPLSRADRLLCLAHAGQGCRLRCRWLCGLVDEDPSLAELQADATGPRLRVSFPGQGFGVNVAFGVESGHLSWRK